MEAFIYQLVYIIVFIMGHYDINVHCCFRSLFQILYSCAWETSTKGYKTKPTVSHHVTVKQLFPSDLFINNNGSLRWFVISLTCFKTYKNEWHQLLHRPVLTLIGPTPILAAPVLFLSFLLLLRHAHSTLFMALSRYCPNLIVLTWFSDWTTESLPVT